MKRKKHHHHNVDQIMESSSKVVGTKTRLGGFSSDYILLDFTPKTRKNPFAYTLLDFPKKQDKCKNLPKILKKSLSFSSGFSPKNLDIKNNWGSKKLAKSTNFDVKARRKVFFIIFSLLPYTLLSCSPWDLCLFTQKLALIKQKTFMMKPFIWPCLFYDLVKPNVKWNLLKLHF